MSLDTVFNFVLASTINASIAGIFVFLTKKLAGRILPHKFKVLLWSVFIVKMFFPIGPESKLSVFNSKYFYTGSNIQEIFLENINVPINTEIETISLLPMLWIFGFIVTSLWLLLSNIILSLKLKTFSKPIDERINNIFADCQKKLNIKRKIRLVNQSVLDGISLYGMLSPKVIITDKIQHLTDREIEYVFYHELCHYKRKDILTNYLIALIQAIHWFNPIIHVFAKFIRQDIELATDEKTISLIGSKEKKAYGSVLISMLEYSKFPTGTVLNVSGSKNHLKKRIRQILCYKRQTKYSICLFFILIAALSFATLTTAVSVKSTDIPQINTEIEKKTVKKDGRTVILKTEDINEEPPEIKKEQDEIQTPSVSEKESAVLDSPSPNTGKLFPEAKVKTLPPGTDFDLLLNSALKTGKSREYSQNVNLNYFCAVRDFVIKEDNTVSLGTYIPDHNGNISIYINSSSSQRINIILLKDGQALINASVKPSKINLYLLTGLVEHDAYELILTVKPDHEYSNDNISGKVLIN